MTIDETLDQDIRHMSTGALRSLAARCHRRGWTRVLASIAAEFRARAGRS